MPDAAPKTIDEYIQSCPEDSRPRLNELRGLIHSASPEPLAEKISWGMPTFVLKRNLVHFALHKNHIGFYPGASGVENFANELSGYKCSKGAIQFPHKAPLPADLIARIVRFRVKENAELKI